MKSTKMRTCTDFNSVTNSEFNKQFQIFHLETNNHFRWIFFGDFRELSRFNLIMTRDSRSYADGVS